MHDVGPCLSLRLLPLGIMYNFAVKDNSVANASIEFTPMKIGPSGLWKGMMIPAKLSEMNFSRDAKRAGIPETICALYTGKTILLGSTLTALGSHLGKQPSVSSDQTVHDWYRDVRYTCQIMLSRSVGELKEQNPVHNLH